MIKFQPGIRKVDFNVEILPNDDKEWHETFTVNLGENEHLTHGH